MNYIVLGSQGKCGIVVKSVYWPYGFAISGELSLSLLGATSLSADNFCKQFGPRSRQIESKQTGLQNITFKTFCILGEYCKRAGKNITVQRIVSSSSTDGYFPLEYRLAILMVKNQ